MVGAAGRGRCRDGIVLNREDGRPVGEVVAAGRARVGHAPVVCVRDVDVRARVRHRAIVGVDVRIGAPIIGVRSAAMMASGPITATSAIEPEVIHIFEPLRIQSSPSFFAVVRIDPGSEPESGSVRPKQPISSPAAMPGSQRCFCSSLPHFQIANIASEPWTEQKERSAESPASSSMQATP